MDNPVPLALNATRSGKQVKPSVLYIWSMDLHTFRGFITTCDLYPT